MKKLFFALMTTCTLVGASAVSYAGTLAWKSEIQTKKNEFAIQNISTNDVGFEYLIDSVVITLTNGLAFDTNGGVTPVEAVGIQGGKFNPPGTGTDEGIFLDFNGLPVIADNSTTLTLGFNNNGLGTLPNGGFQRLESWGMKIDIDDSTPIFNEQPEGEDFSLSLTITVYFKDNFGAFRGSVASTFFNNGGGVSIPLSGWATPTPPPNPVPEPATMMLFGSGLVGLAGIVRRRKK